MKTMHVCWPAAAAACGLSVAIALAGTEGITNTFYGQEAGAANASGANTFVGRSAGKAELGSYNVYLGAYVAEARTNNSYNTFVGAQAGQLGSGSGNVYLGYAAGYNRGAINNELVIDNCQISVVTPCDRPLIAGKFDARRLEIDGVVHVTAHRVQERARSQLHFSVTGADVGGWLTSAGDNNFFTSSGARYDADAGGWIQRAADGKAVIAGSGGVGFRIFTASGTAIGAVAAPVTRLHIDYNGLMGVNAAPVAGRAINTSTGAYLSSGGAWTNASSRDLKEDIVRLSPEEAQQAFAGLDPVRFRYKDDGRAHVGFIAEDVPELVATADRKGLSAMDVVAVLTKVVQQQATELAEMKERLRRLEAR